MATSTVLPSPCTQCPSEYNYNMLNPEGCQDRPLAISPSETRRGRSASRAVRPSHDNAYTGCMPLWLTRGELDAQWHGPASTLHRTHGPHSPYLLPSRRSAVEASYKESRVVLASNKSSSGVMASLCS